MFLPADDVGLVFDALAPLGYAPRVPAGQQIPAAGIPLVAEGVRFPLDVFPSLDPAYDDVARRVVRQPFGSERRSIPVLSPEDLVVFKLSFGRAKDWVDLEAIARAGTELDLGVVESTLVELRGPTMYPRVARLRSLFRR